ncbi:tRNA pseudouridine synthase A [Actinomyces wuliandei]|uniref:tRNA pseudouridine synthase A n=1 Tax=Actinomyces wuliandei TaxID=2057743 RepID=UPI001119AF6A|nr:tRNA pseudouridine synthase A [Actinomyces wuliandei]
MSERHKVGGGPGPGGVAASGSGGGTGGAVRAVRVRLDLAYDGTGFSGWAAQPGLRTVEGALTAALTTVLRAPVRLTVAGRTDAGVHAAGQVVHIDVPAAAWQALPGRSQRSPEQALLTRLAGVLAREAQQAWRVPDAPGTVEPSSQGQAGGRDTQEPTAGSAWSASRVPRGASDVVVTAVSQVGPDFDARFGALWRRYTYRVSDGASLRDPRRRGHVLWTGGVLDVEAMQASAVPLLGEHDFLSFCRPRQGASTVRELRQVRWRRVEGTEADATLVTLSVEADAFCHSMVRSLVGAGLEVGRGRRPVAWPAQLLAARSRRGAAPVAPPHGLTLEEVAYPDADGLAAQARRARVRRSQC